MLMPILAERSAALPSLSSAAVETPVSVQTPVRAAVPISGLQSDAALKIIDTLNRHFMGEAVLPPEALTRLVETLAKALNVQQLPQESTVDFARRLASFLETLPPEARQIAEKQLGLRPLAIPIKALAEALRNPGSINAARIATVLDTAPQAAPGTGARQGVPSQQQPNAQVRLQTQPAGLLAAALTGPAAEVSVLQAALKRTFGADDEPPLPRPGQTGKGGTAGGASSNPNVAVSGGLPSETGARDGTVAANRTLPQPAASSAEARQALPAILAQHSILEEAIQALALPATPEEQRVLADIIADGDVPGERLALDSGPGLVEVISQLPEQAVDALSEKLAETLKEFTDILALTLPDAEEADSGRSARFAQQSGAGKTEADVLLPASFDAPDTDTAQTRSLMDALALPVQEPDIDDRDMAPSRHQQPGDRTEQTREMPIVFRNAEMAVARELVPFAMLHYLPAPNDIVGETEENRRPYERDAEAGQEGAGGDQRQEAEEHPASDDQTGSAAAPEPSPDDIADNEAYQLYIRMGGIL